MTETRELCFGAAPFLNSAPLIEGMAAEKGVRVVLDVPSRLSDRVLAGSADAALVPVVDYLFDDRFAMIDGIGVCADGAVRSVVLECRKPIAEARSVAADRASRTSNLLAQLLLRRRLGSDAKVFSEVDPEGADAAVIIGDAALQSKGRGAARYDLAEEWRAMTGLPFVFAVWVYRRGNDAADRLTRIAHESLARGERAAAEIARRAAPALGLSPEICAGYLTQCIYYRLTARERRAMDMFRRLVVEEDLAATAEGPHG
jgi:chorismate dehydratase